MAEMFEKNVDVFGRGDTAEQNDLAVEGQFFRETLHVPLQRRAVTRIVFVNVYFGKLAEIGEADRRGCWDQPAGWRDNEDGGTSASYGREGVRIGEFSSEIEPTKKGEDFAERWRLVAPQASSEIELRAFAHDDAGALAAGVGRRKEKHAGHWFQETIVISAWGQLALSSFPKDASFP